MAYAYQSKYFQDLEQSGQKYRSKYFQSLYPAKSASSGKGGGAISTDAPAVGGPQLLPIGSASGAFLSDFVTQQEEKLEAWRAASWREKMWGDSAGAAVTRDVTAALEAQKAAKESARRAVEQNDLSAYRQLREDAEGRDMAASQSAALGDVYETTPQDTAFQRYQAADALVRAYSSGYGATPEELMAAVTELNAAKRQLDALGVDTRNSIENVGRSALGGTMSAGKGIVNELGYLAQLGARSAVLLDADQQAAQAALDAYLTGDRSLATAAEERKEQALKDYAAPMQALVHWGDAFNAETAERTKYVTGTGKIINDIAAGVGGMVPTIAANLIAPGSGLYVLFTQAAGNATEEALNAGYSNERALGYGVAVGGIEVLTEKMFGGIPGLNVGSVDKLVENTIKNQLKSAAAQRAVTLLMDALGEGFEEFVSEFGDKLASNLLLPGYDTRSWGEVAGDAGYSFLVGALTSAVMQLPTETVKRLPPKKAAALLAEKTKENLKTQAKDVASEAVGDTLEAALRRQPDSGTTDLSLPSPEAWMDLFEEWNSRANVSNLGTTQTAATGATGKSLYAQREADAIRHDGKTFRNVIAGIDISISDFFAKWRNGRKSHQGEKLEKLYIGRLSDSSLEAASDVLGYDLKERDVIITNDDIKHIYDDHPDLPTWAVEALPEIISTPDSIIKGHQGSGKNAGKTGVIFQKRMPDGNVVTVQFDNPGRSTMQITTVYTTEKAKATTSKATDTTMPAAHTPEASDPVTSANQRIPQGAESVKSAGYGLNWDKADLSLPSPEAWMALFEEWNSRANASKSVTMENGGRLYTPEEYRAALDRAEENERAPTASRRVPSHDNVPDSGTTATVETLHRERERLSSAEHMRALYARGGIDALLQNDEDIAALNQRIETMIEAEDEADAPTMETAATRAERAEAEQNLVDELADREAEAVREEREAAEAANAQAEREGKKADQPQAPKAPKSRAALKQWIYEHFSIQRGDRKRVGEIVDTIADEMQTRGKNSAGSSPVGGGGGMISEARIEQLFDAIYGHGSVTREADDYFRNFRQSVQGSKIYVDEAVKAEFGDDWNAFRQEAWGSGIRLVNDPAAGGIDVHAQELASIYGDGWLTNETDPKATLEDIVDMAARGRPETLTNAEIDDILRGEYGDEAVRQKLDGLERDFREMLDGFRQLAETEGDIRAYADRRVETAREHEKTVRENADRRVEAARRQADLRVEAAREHAAEQIQDSRDRLQKYIRGSRKLAKQQMERRALSQLQNKILKSLQWLSKNRSRAPEALRAEYDKVLANIDTLAINAAKEAHIDKASGKTWRELTDIYKAARDSDPNFLPSAELENNIKRLDMDHIGEMDVDALHDLYKAAMDLRTEFYNRNNVINSEINQTFSEAYHAATDEINAAKGPAKRGEKWFNNEQMTPMNVLQRFGGWAKGTFYSFAKGLEQGDRDAKAYTVKAQKAIAPVIEQYKDWARKADGQGKDGIWYSFEVPELLELRMGDKPILSDKTVKVWYTPAQKVHMALEAENYDNLSHMAGGRTFADKELYSKGQRAEAFARGTTLRLAPETVKAMIADMTEEEKALYNALKAFYNGTARDEINRVSNILYGYDRAMTNNYAPIFTDENYVGHEPGIYDSTAEGVGHLKSRQGHSRNPSYQISALDAFERHTDQTARFVGYAIPIRNMNTLMNWRESGNRSMRKTIAGKWGAETGANYIDNLLTDLQNTRYKEDGTIDTGTNNILSNYVSAVFGANPGIVFKQAASFPQAAAVLGYDTLPKLSQLRDKNIDTEIIGKYTPELDYRLLGYATPETAAIKNNPGVLDRNKVTRFLFRGGAITAMDGATVKRIWPWAENYVSKNFPKLEKGTDAFYKKTAEMFNEAVSLTQPMYDTMHRAGIMRNGNGITRALTMFKTVPLQQYNTLRKAFGELSAAKKGSAEYQAAAKKAGNAVTATLASAAMLEVVELLNQLWKNGLKGYRDDDDELTVGSVAAKFAENAVEDLAGVVIGGKEFAQVLENIFTGKKWYGIEIPGGEQLNDIIDEFRGAADTVGTLLRDATDVVGSGGDLGEYFRRNGADYAGALKEIAETAAMYIKGLPVENIEKYLTGTLRAVAPELYIEMQDFFDVPGRSDLKGLEGKPLETRVQDILENRFGKMPEAAAKELARLYPDYGSAVILPPTPASVSVNGEDVPLDAGARQKYDNAVQEAAKAALAGLEGDEQYQDMDDAERAAYIKRLYSGAAEYAKLQTVPGYAEANPTTAAKYDALKKAGLNAGEIAAGLALGSLAESEKDADGETISGSKKLDAMRTIDTLDISDEQKIALLDAMGYSTEETMWNTAYKGDDYESYYYLSDSAKEKYVKYCAWMDVADFADAYAVCSGFSADKDLYGKAISGSKAYKVIDYINGLDLKKKGKDVLLYVMGYSTDETMWNTAYKGDDYKTYYFLSDGAKKAYTQYCSWMGVKSFSKYYDDCQSFHDIKDESGKTTTSKREQVIEYIDKIHISEDQKSALFAACGYKESSLKYCPWWNEIQLHGPYYPW